MLRTAVLGAIVRLEGRDGVAPRPPLLARRYTVEGGLAALERHAPELVVALPGARVCDFGCGKGYQAAVCALRGAVEVLALDTHEPSLAQARRTADEAGVGGRVRTAARPEPGDLGRFDIVFSQDSFEHFPDPEGILREMIALARPGGMVIVSFGTPWGSPYGAHMHFFTRVPWVHFIFGERAVMAVRARFRLDGARTYAELAQGLNKMTVRRFERLMAASGLRVERVRLEGARGLQVATRVPLLRELLTIHVAAVCRR